MLTWWWTHNWQPPIKWKCLELPLNVPWKPKVSVLWQPESQENGDCPQRAMRRQRAPFCCCSWGSSSVWFQFLSWKKDTVGKGRETKRDEGSASIRGKTEKSGLFTEGIAGAWPTVMQWRQWVKCELFIQCWGTEMRVACWDCWMDVSDGCIRWMQGGMTGALWRQCEQVQEGVRKCTKSLWRGC